MTDPQPLRLFLLTGEQAARYESLASLVAGQVRASCPDVEVDVQHVGATAVPGLLTKGDLDVVVRVKRLEFGSVVAALGKHLPSAHPENWLAGESASFALPPLAELGAITGAVQVVTIGGAHDVFTRVRDLLQQHERWREQMNAAKRRGQSLGNDRYRAHKVPVYEQLLAWVGQDSAGRHWFDFWEHHRPEPGSTVEITLEHPDGRVELAAGLYRARPTSVNGEDGEVELSDCSVVSSDTPARVKTWTLIDR